MKDEDKAVRSVITGEAVPKSLSLIELEKNYAMFADMLSHVIDRIQQIEDDINKLEKKITDLAEPDGKYKLRK